MISNVNLTNPGSLTFSNDGVYLPGNNALYTNYSLTLPITVSFWAKTTAWGSDVCPLMISYDANGGYGWRCGTNPGGLGNAIFSQMPYGYGNKHSTVLSTGIYQFYYISVNNSNNTAISYFNNNKMSCSTNCAVQTNNVLAVGRWGGYASFYYNGYIKNVRIYNRVLADEEILYLYNNSL